MKPTRANLQATHILNYQHPTVQHFIMQQLGAALELPASHFLQCAHQRISQYIRPIYTVDELQASSSTFEKKQGSCSQRMACLESICRARGIPTRVRALWLAGAFWYPRFGITKRCIPEKILLPWAQFYIEDTWLDFDEIYSSKQLGSSGFRNDAETIFDAVAHTSVDFFQKNCQKNCEAGCSSSTDLSRFVIEDAGFFDSRDALYDYFGSFQHSLRGYAFELVYGGRKSA